MSSTNREYELNILKMAINKELHKIAIVTEDNLSFLESNIDQIVWDTATKIYNQSGHRVELSMIRDLVINRINSIKQIIYNQNQQKRQIEQNLQISIKKAQSVAENSNLEQEIIHVLDVCEGNKDKALIFLRVRKVIIEQLDVEKDMVTWSSHISNDLGADELDTIELAMELEEEFDAELDIPEDMLGSMRRTPEPRHWENDKPSYNKSNSTDSTTGGLIGFLSFLGSVSSSCNDSIPVACTVGELTDFIHKKLQLLP
jgi:acyl carrier protein